MQVENTPLGFEIRTPQITVFLGGRKAQLPALAEAYPQFSLVRVKQIHSNVVVQSSDPGLDYQVLADAHFTDQKLLALCIITADCLPIFFYDTKTSLIAGVHAGWRGVASRIIPGTLEALSGQGVDVTNLSVIIGPHIQRASFEVGNDVKDQILNSLGPMSRDERSLYFDSLPDSKSLVDLNMVVRTQLQQSNINFDNVFNLQMDTVTNKDFHSYRRDRENSGRQISFISRTL